MSVRATTVRGKWVTPSSCCHTRYDLAGNLTTFTDRKGQVTTFQYDALNRRTQATYADATTTFTYDTVGRLVKTSDTAPGAGAINFTYDILDRLIQETTPRGTVGYQYDVLGRRTQMVANGQQPTMYQYDAASRLTRVEQGALFAALGYDNANRRMSLSYSNNTMTNYAYDLASRLTGITHNGPSGVIEALTYQYDASGNRVSLTRNNGTASLLPNPVASATYDAANEQTAFAGITLTYDPNGNLTNDGTNTYVWDARNRLVSISGGVTASFKYDALGRRTSKVVGSAASQFLYDGNDIAAEVGGGSIGASYLRSLNIDEPFVRQTGAGNEHYHTDALGSSLALSNSQGASAATYSYEPFGKTTVTGTTLNPFQFTGRENDGSELSYYRARYYSPLRQRFISEDPISFFGGDLNRYAYVKNKPLEFRDSRGTFVDTLTDLGFLGYDLYLIAIDGRKNLGSNLTALGLDAAGAITPFVTGLGVASRAAKNLPNSPAIDPKSIAGKSPSDIDSYAKQNGLIPKGPDPMSGKGSYIDPITGEQRVLVHPHDSKCGPHCHVNDPNGQRLDINGQAVLPESPEAHLPLAFP